VFAALPATGRGAATIGGGERKGGSTGANTAVAWLRKLAGEAASLGRDFCAFSAWTVGLGGDGWVGFGRGRSTGAGVRDTSVSRTTRVIGAPADKPITSAVPPKATMANEARADTVRWRDEV